MQNPRALSTMAQSVANAVPEIAGALPVAGAQLATGPVHQNMGETKPVHSSTQASTTANPTSINVNHPALAPWKATFDKNAATAKDTGEIQKSQAITDFVLSQRDPAYAAAKQKMSDNPTESNQEPTKMAEGGVVQTQRPKQPFNTDMADKLKEFLKSRKEK